MSSKWLWLLMGVAWASCIGIANAQTSPDIEGIRFPRERMIADEELDNVLERTSYLRQSTPTREQISSQLLDAIGLLPRFVLEVDNATFYLSLPTDLGAGRQIAVGIVEAEGACTARVFYRSNSQFTWRMCDTTEQGRHLGKGFHEYDKQLPTPVTAALLKHADNPTVLRWAARKNLSQTELANMVLDGLTDDHQHGRGLGTVVEGRGFYCSREYASHIAMIPMPFSSNSAKPLDTATGNIPNPQTVVLPIRELLPDFTRPLIEFTFNHPEYARTTKSEPELIGRVFDSVNGRARYLYFEDSAGRAALVSVEAISPSITPLGLRSRYFEQAGITSPLMEYASQIPGDYGGSQETVYQLNWNYVRESPFVQMYYRERNLEIPPPVARIGISSCPE